MTLMGGQVITDGIFKTLSEHFTKLPQCYCVMQNDEQYELYTHPTGVKTANANFLLSTRGSWHYIKPNFIIDCYVKCGA